MDPRDPLKPVGRPPQLPPVRPSEAARARPADQTLPAAPAAPVHATDQLGLEAKGTIANPLGGVLDREATGPEGAEADALFALLDGADAAPDGDAAAVLDHLAAGHLPNATAQATMGRLAASLASANWSLDPAVWARLRLTGPFARAFMDGLRGLSPRARAQALGGVPVDVRRALVDALGTDGDDLSDNAELVGSLAAADPELAAEVLAWAGPALAQAVAERPRADEEAGA